jgi:hypothetical protein
MLLCITQLNRHGIFHWKRYPEIINICQGQKIHVKYAQYFLSLNSECKILRINKSKKNIDNIIT